MESFKAQTTLESELLGLLASQVKVSPVPVVLSMGLVAFMASSYSPVWMWGSWFALVVILQVVRSLLFVHLSRQVHVDPALRLRRAIAMNLGNSLLHILSLLWVPMFSLYEAAVHSMLFVGMGVASIATTVGYRPFSLTHVLVGLFPIFSMWLWSGISGDGGAVAVSLGVIGFGYGLTLLTVADRIFLMYLETFDNRQQLQLALAQAEAADRAKTRFLASASHDLRQPIHALSLFTAALGMRPLDERSQNIVGKLESAVQALSYQMDALLDISRLDAGIVNVRKESLCLYTLLERLREELTEDATARGIDLVLDCPEDAWVRTDLTLLERIARNIMVNAISHNENCTVNLLVQLQGSDWHLRISDTGRGVPADEQGRIFEEFYQLENPERDRSKGLGLGLAIVHRLSSLLDLNMQFLSEPGLGTSFAFLLNAATEPPRDDDAPQAHSLPPLSVLVVDDESAVREGMQELLESLGCSVLSADGTDTALDIAGDSRPDLALVDFRLRGQDSGLLVIQGLRRIYPDLPAIMISGDTAPDRLREAKEAGVPLLSKPVMVEPLKQAIVATYREEG